MARRASRVVKAINYLDDPVVLSLMLQRHTLAKLAAKTPQFMNPIDVWIAEALRNDVLAFPMLLPVIDDQPEKRSAEPRRKSKVKR